MKPEDMKRIGELSELIADAENGIAFLPKYLEGTVDASTIAVRTYKMSQEELKAVGALIVQLLSKRLITLKEEAEAY